MSESDFKLIDFDQFNSVLDSRSGLMYKKTSENGFIHWTTFYAPLHPLVWIVGVSLIMFLAVGYSVAFKRILEGRSPGSESLLMTIHGFFMMGHHIEPEAISARIIFLLLYFLGWFLWASHSSMLTAHLSIRQESQPFTSLFDLLYNTDFRVLFTNGDGEIDKFKA